MYQMKVRYIQAGITRAIGSAKSNAPKTGDVYFDGAPLPVQPIYIVECQEPTVFTKGILRHAEGTFKNLLSGVLEIPRV